MASGDGSLAILYDDSAYVETVRPAAPAGPEAPLGLMGRQVAGREFLQAFLTSGLRDDLTAVVYNSASAASLQHLCRQHPSSGTRPRQLRVVMARDVLQAFFPEPPARILYTPCPPDPSFAWARDHAGPAAFALSGVTHTLSTAGAARVLCEMVTAPYEEFDALICTSRAVVRMVRDLTGAYADYLRDRHGGTPALRPRLETIPLGVNPAKYRPPTPEERAARRAALRIAGDDVAVLFVGRFTPHAKAHPFPMFHGLARAVQETGRRAHLILSGWAPNESLLRGYVDSARAFASGIPVSIVNGVDPELRHGVWQAADVFTSLPDSIQETFGLVIVEAMAVGLPVVASDWDGYRDLVLDGQTGLLVPTYMVSGATADASVRLLLDSNYDAFLAECNQTVSVDPAAAVAAYARLLRDPDLRRGMGKAGRQRVLDHFTWDRVVAAYEQLWQSQERQRRDWLTRQGRIQARPAGPACLAAPELSFAGYPTRLLVSEVRLAAAPAAADRLEQILAQPLCTYAAEQRIADPAALRMLLQEAGTPRTLIELDEVLARLGVDQGKARATAAWLLKYGLLRLCASG
jgi:glycosyltransferase involved in cell wall biosynthesis